MNTIKSESNNFTQKDFADALFKLKKDIGLSYMQIAVKAKLSDTYLINIVNRKNLAPNDGNIEKIAKALGVEPEYFFEYRLRRLINLINDNREYLDMFLNEIELSQKKRKAQKARVSSRKAAEGVGKVGEASK